MEQERFVDVSYFFSEPLVSSKNGRNIKAIENIDIKSDLENLISVLHQSNRQVRFRADSCTIDNLRNVLTKGARVIHYSGHGTSNRSLSFEDGKTEIYMCTFTYFSFFSFNTSKKICA